MKKVTITVIMLVIAMFMLTTNVQAYTMSFSGTKTMVEPGETFNVTVSVDEATTRANGHIKYDSSLFTFVSSTGSNMTANATSGTVQWLYSEPVGQETGTKSFTFTFKAADVTETKKGTFSMEDFIAITKDNEEGYGQDKNTIGGASSVEVTINKKETKPAEPTWKITPSGDFTLEKGESKQLTADEDVTWSTSDSSVATVDKNGKVTGVGEGSATITATDKDGNKQTVTVTVKDNSQTPGDDDKHDNWSIEPSGDFSLKVGEKKKLTADGEGVKWKSSNEKVATVDQNGNVTAVGAGTATITATDKYGNTKTIKVTVTKKTTTAGKKDNTQTPNKKLPQTGENAGKFVVLGIAGIVLAAGLVFKKKAKELDKLFVLLPIVAVLSLSGTVRAEKIADNDNLQAGTFTNLISGKNVLAINPKKAFETKNVIDVKVIENIFENEGKVTALKDKDGKNLELTVKSIPTGAVATIEYGETKDYVILLYGDANGDGKICDVSDIDVIRQDYVFNKKAEGVYKLAADLYVDNKLDVRDIQRMVSKYLGKLDGGLVNKFPGDEETDNGETDDVSIAVARVESTGKMYKTLQHAVNAVGTSADKITLLKNSTENVKISGKGDLTIDFNGNDFTTKKGGYGITIAGNVSFINSRDKESKFTGKEKAIINITKDNSKVTFGKGININSSTLGAAIEIADGVKGVEVSMNDASWSNSATGCFVQDNGKDTKINILTGTITAYDFLVKQAEGANTTITIGDKEKEISDKDPVITSRAAWWVGLNDDTTINMYNGKLSSRSASLDGFRDEVVDGLREDAFLYVSPGKTEAYYKELAKDQTLKVEEAVVVVNPEKAYFKTAQSGIDYAEIGRQVVLLKDVEEKLDVSEEKNITLDLNGYNLTGPKETFYTIATEGTLSIVNSGDKEATIDRPATTDTHNEERGTVTGADIWVKESGNVSVGEKVELVIQIGGGANIENTGSGDVTVDGANLSMRNGAYGTNAIRDKGEDSDIFVFRGDLETYSGEGKTTITKSSTGNLYIGKDSKVEEGVSGIQEEILLKNRTENGNEDELYINGNVSAKNAQIYYYNGEIEGVLIYKKDNQPETEVKEPILRDGARLVKPVKDVGLHYEKLAEGELPISYSLYFSRDQVIEDVDKAVCYLTDDTEFGAKQYFYRYFKTVQDAVNVEPNGYEGTFNGVSANEGGKLNIITIMKHKTEDEETSKTEVKESIEIPEGKKVLLFGEGTLTGADAEDYTIEVKGDLVIDKTTVVKEGNQEANSNIANIIMKDKGTLLLKDDAKLTLKENNSANIINEGSGDITIDNADVTSSANHSIGIYDFSSDSNIYIKEGLVSGTTAICKKNGGKIEIGELSDERILDENSLYIHGTTYCLDVCRKTEVYFYNGKLTNDFRGGKLCCESNENTAMPTEHTITAGNNKWDIVVKGSDIHQAYYVEDGKSEQEKGTTVYDVATGQTIPAAAAAASANPVKVANIATMLALDIFNQ